ncbi:Na(+)/H(+) antiporter subunit B [Halalkalibacter urbisdiaboli]|uniref:Na(+)/H(+) antiporter subunit B n=1 Tax=Halalkalibacter urbisdiaboli TaxID=1960589 RepID=UPI000B4445C5|nr:Na(+)/H(+) antiporter subunit B [Halalkalibacter urbisdiaboli]
MRTNDVVLKTATQLVTFIIIIFSIYVFLQGHHNPGGGFIGGLMTAAAIILIGIAFDIKTVRRILPFDFKLLTATGLLIAVLTGIGAFIFDATFLTHTYDYFYLPLLGKTELATALLFDIGVYFVVIGVTLTIIFTIGEDS